MSFNNQNNYYRPSMFGGFQFFPPVIKSLLLINVAVFILQRFFFAGFPAIQNWMDLTFGLMPMAHGFYPWQLITYQFLHADFWHILFNMVFGLWMFGMEVEHVWGSRKLLIYYLSCGVVAGLFQLILAPMFEPTLGPTIGASGAVYGVLVAFAALFPERYIFLYFLIPVKVKYFVLILIVIGVLSVGGAENVANLAHLGGAAAGYAYVLWERRRLHVRSDVSQNIKQSWNNFSTSWGTPSAPSPGGVVDAKVYEIKDAKNFESKEKSKEDLQKRIDGILDKISQSGYQNLTDEEKKILFEASKRMN